MKAAGAMWGKNVRRASAPVATVGDVARLSVVHLAAPERDVPLCDEDPRALDYRAAVEVLGWKRKERRRKGGAIDELERVWVKPSEDVVLEGDCPRFSVSLDAALLLEMALEQAGLGEEYLWRLMATVSVLDVPRAAVLLRLARATARQRTIAALWAVMEAL